MTTHVKGVRNKELMQDLMALGKATLPIWGGAMDRGQPCNPGAEYLVHEGFAYRVTEPCNGYVITQKGRERLARSAHETGASQMLKIIRLVANGHHDPRRLCREFLKEHEA